MYSLKNKNILVTGSASGLGFQISKNLAINEKSNVICLDKKKINIPKIKEFIKIDFLNTKALEKAVVNLLNKYKKIDGLVNCAAVTLPEKKFPRKEFETWKKTLTINLDAGFIICSTLCLHAVNNKYRLNIVNFTSIGGHMGFPKNSAYCTSKGGVSQLTKSLAYDYGSKGIRANCIVPGYFKTEMNKKSWNNRKERNLRSSKTMLGRWGSPDEICGPVNFLLSDQSSYITGSDIIVDGGWLSKGF